MWMPTLVGYVNAAEARLSVADTRAKESWVRPLDIYFVLTILISDGTQQCIYHH